MGSAVMFAGDEDNDDDCTSGPYEWLMYDHDADRNSAWCDQCGVHHSGDCPDNEETDGTDQ